MGDHDRDEWLIYATAYEVARQVAEEVAPRDRPALFSANTGPPPPMPTYGPKAEAMRRVLRRLGLGHVELAPEARELVAEAIDDALSGRRPRY